MNLRFVILAVASASGLSACSLKPGWVYETPPSADERAIERRHDREDVNLCRMMSRDDPRYKHMDCKHQRPGGQA